MPKRRQYGTGSIHRAHKTGCPKTRCTCPWRGTTDAGYTKTGGRRRITVTAKTEADVKRRLAEKQRELARGIEARGRTTVKAWAETWLDMTARTVRPKTHVTDKGAVRYIIAAIGQKKLTDLTPADVRAVRAAIEADGHRDSTALRYHGVLMRLLKAAQAEGHDVPARALATRPPKPNVTDRTAIPTTDVLRLLKAAGELPHGSRWLAAFLLGLRQGEALGLTWQQVDHDTLTISWQLQALPYLDKKNRKAGFLLPDGYETRQLDGRMHLVRPKSRAGWRVLPLLPALGQPLEVWREQMNESSLHGLVWPAADGRPKDPTADRDEWRGLQDAADVRHPSGRYYMGHEARHSTATLLLELGIPEAIRVQIMGHSTIASTNAYTHVDVSLAREALGKAAAALQLG